MRIAMLVLLVMLFLAGCLNPFVASDYCAAHPCILKPVSGHSMEPVLREGDLIRIGIDYYQFFPLQRKDIVIIDFNVDNSLRVKRLVGLPGDDVQITPAGDIAVNGAVVMTHPDGRPFTSDSFPLFKYPSPATARVVPPHKVFVISDNAETGFDSLDYGFVDEGFVIGKVLSVIPPAVSN